MNQPVISKTDIEREVIAFPKLEACEIEVAKQCGRVEIYQPGESLYHAGDQPVDCFIIVTGQAEIIDPSGDEERILLEYGPGNFTGEMAILTQRPSPSSCHAITYCETVRLTAAEMRHLMVKCPSLGEKWIPALLRRRELMEKAGFEGLRVR
jgi:thioredoxin reductase (NADPH)